MENAAENQQDSLIEKPTPSRSERTLKTAAWVAFGVIALVFFTLVKLPEDRIKALVQGAIASALAPRGITLVAGHTDISAGLGITYAMKDVTLNFPPPEPPLHMDELRVSPSILPLLLGRMSGDAEIRNGDGHLSTSFSMSQKRPSQLSISFKSKNLNIGKLGLLPLLANVQGSGIIDGSGSVEGDFSVPSSLSGDLSLKLKNITLDQQAIMGFSIPNKITISEGNADISIEKSRMIVKSGRLGKPGNPADDIQGTFTGNVMLGRQWETSTLDLKMRFTLSQQILKALPLIDTLLASLGGKQPDGSYAFHLTGPMYSPGFAPLQGGM